MFKFLVLIDFILWLTLRKELLAERIFCDCEAQKLEVLQNLFSQMQPTKLNE